MNNKRYVLKHIFSIYGGSNVKKKQQRMIKEF